MTKPVSKSNTKQEIYDAYEEAVNKLTEMDNSTLISIPKDEKKEIKKDLPMDDSNTIIKRIGDLRLNLVDYLNKIVDKLVVETENLNIINIEKQKILSEIETAHKIKVQATTLENIIQVNSAEQERMNAEIASKKQEWFTQQKTHENDTKELLENQVKLREREEDEYNYNLKLKRQKEDEIYQKKIAETNEKLRIREEVLLEKENEAANLKAKITELEKNLINEVELAKTSTEANTTLALQTKYDLEAAKVDAETKINKVVVDNLTQQIKSKDAEIKELKVQLDKSTQHIKDIAVSVVDTRKQGVYEQNQRENGNDKNSNK